MKQMWLFKRAQRINAEFISSNLVPAFIAAFKYKFLLIGLVDLQETEFSTAYLYSVDIIRGRLP